MCMQNIKDLYILGQPIETERGLLYFTKVKDYPKLMKFSYILTLDKHRLIQTIQKQNKDPDTLGQILEILKKLSLFEFMYVFSGDDAFKGTLSDILYQQHRKLFQFCFHKDTFPLIKTDEEFEYYINLIREINCVHYEKADPNPEFERRNQLRRLQQQRSGKTITFESMITSVEAITGQSTDDMTVYKLHKLFNRITYRTDFYLSVFGSMFDEKTKVIPWYKEDVEQKPQEIYITQEQLEGTEVQLL